MSDNTNPVPSEASNRALFSDSMNRWRVPVKMGAGGQVQETRGERERADSDGRVHQNQNPTAAQRILQQQQAQQQAPQRVVNVPSSVLAAYQGKPQQIPLDRPNERRRSESNIEHPDAPPNFFMYDSTGRTFEPSGRQQASLPQWQERGRQRNQQPQQQQQQPQQQQPQQPQPQLQAQAHQPSQSRAHSPRVPSRRASAQATPTQSSVSISSANQNVHHNILASPVALQRLPPTPTATSASTSNIDVNAAPTPRPHPATSTTVTPAPAPAPTTTTITIPSNNPKPPTHPTHPIVIQNAAKALSPIRHLYETAWSQTVLSVQSEMARMHGELVGVIEHERGLHAELEGEYVRVREERERVAEETRRMGREVEEARRGAWVVGRELERMRAEVERMRMAQGQGQGQGERERVVREELEVVRMQLAEKAKELEVERLLRYNAERKLRDVQTVTARIFSTPESETESPDLRMQVDTLDIHTNTNNTRRGSESASTVVGTPDSDRSPSLKQGYYRPQAQYEHHSHDQHQHQHQYQQVENYDHEEVGDRDRARTKRVARSSARSMSVSSTATRSPPTPIIETSRHAHAPEPQPQPHLRPQSHTRPPGPILIAPAPAPHELESLVRDDPSVPVPLHSQAHAHAQQMGADARSQPQPDAVPHHPWHRPQAVPVHTLEEDEEIDERGERQEPVPMPGYGKVLVSRGPHPPLLPSSPILPTPGQDEKAGVIELRSPSPTSKIQAQAQPQPRRQAQVQLQPQAQTQSTLALAPAPALRVAIPPPSPTPAPASRLQSPVTKTPVLDSVSASVVGPTPSQLPQGQSPPMARLSRPVSPEQHSSAQPAFPYALGPDQAQRPVGARASQDIPPAPPPPPWASRKASTTPGAVEESAVGGKSRQGSVDAQVRRPSVPPTAQQQARQYIMPTPPPPPWVAQNLTTTPTAMQAKPYPVDVVASRPGSAVQRPSPRIQSQPGPQIQQQRYSPKAASTSLAPQHLATTSTSAATDIALTPGPVVSRPGSSAPRLSPTVEAPAPEPQRPSLPAITQQYIPHPPPPPPWLPQNTSTTATTAPPLNTTMNAAQPIPNVPPPLPPPAGPFAHYVWPPRTPVEALQAPSPDPRTVRPATVPVAQPLPPRRAFTTPNTPLSALESTTKGTADTGTPVITRKRDRQEYEGDGENAATAAAAAGGGAGEGEEQEAGRGRRSIVRSWTEPNGERARQRMRVKLEEGEISEEPQREPEPESASAREGAKEPGVARPSAEGKGERKMKHSASAKTPVRNKIGINHMDLLYEMRGAQLLCRMCRSAETVEPGMKPMSFPAKATWPELVGHCQMAHPKSCEDLERLSPSQVAELRQRLTSSKMTGFVLR